MKATKAAFISGLAGLAVLAIHSGARAQQPASPPPQAEAEPPQYPPAPPPEQAEGQPQTNAAQPGGYPPGYGPPPGYQQPPPAGYDAPPPRYYYPPPPPPRYYGRRYAYYPPPPPPPVYTLERPFMLGGSLGLASLHYDTGVGTTTNAAVGYSLRLGFGVAPRLLFLIEVNGAAASDSDVYGNSVAYDQTLYDLGLQVFLTRKFFLRGGAGLGNIRAAFNDGGAFAAKVGFGLTASAGVELLQGYNWSFELAAQWITGFYSNETWTSGAVNLGFNFF
jgi:hypothetical protein